MIMGDLHDSTQDSFLLNVSSYPPPFKTKPSKRIGTPQKNNKYSNYNFGPKTSNVNFGFQNHISEYDSGFNSLNTIKSETKESSKQFRRNTQNANFKGNFEANSSSKRNGTLHKNNKFGNYNFGPKTSNVNYGFQNHISEYDSGLNSLNTIDSEEKESSKQFRRNTQNANFKGNFESSYEQPTVLHEQRKRPPAEKFKKPIKQSTDSKQNTSHEGKKLVLSSLFNSNPEIPYIETRPFTGKEESLFSDKTFDKMDLHPHLVSCLQTHFNITKVTQVQSQAIPALRNGNDALIKSCTGSGKTLSYAVPIVQKLQEIQPKIQRSYGVYVLVILPTRELALQSFLCFSKLTKAFNWIVPGYLIGGEKKKSEKARIRKGINILISTPGRLLDHLDHTSNLSLKAIQWLIIDEADRLLEQGYEASILKILSFCSPEKGFTRQTVLLSATLSKEVEKLAGMSLNNPKYIDIANDNATMEDLVIPSQLKQYVVLAPMKTRLVTLSAFIVEKCAKGNFKSLIFMASQSTVDFHFLLFRQILKPMLKVKGHRTKFFKLHGNMKQEERTEIFNRFLKIDIGILLCTDVAARGLDLPSVDWIVQYSAPINVESYVHRVGRTARIGESGFALLFLIPSEIRFLHLLHDREINIEERDAKEILKSLLLIADVIHESARQSQSIRAIEEHATKLQFKYEDAVYSDSTLYDSAKDGFLTFVQAYSSYNKSLRNIFPFSMLHLGHVAKSFCLRESPSELGCKFSKTIAEKSQKKKDFRNPSQKRKRSMHVSEYDSGFSSLKNNNFSTKKRRKK